MLPTDAQQFDLMHVIGHGESSVVWAARCVPTNRLVCVRVCDLDAMSGDLSPIARCFDFWSSTNHPNSLKLLGKFTEGAQLWIVTEYEDGGSLRDLLTFSYENGIKNANFIATIAKEILNFLDFYHKNERKAFNQLRSKHVLLSLAGDVKLCGFGLGARGKEADTDLSRDIHALGVLMYEMWSGRRPARTGDKMTFPVDIPRDLAQCIRKCVAMKSEKKDPVASVMKDKFMRRAQESKYISATISGNVMPLWRRYEMISKRRSLSLPKRMMEPSRSEFVFDFGDEPASSSIEQPPEVSPIRQTLPRIPVRQTGRFAIFE